ncbi:transposase [Methylococcus capsulatus]|uniref:transposase n=1 Tax=Methylococcus capsulatus TaxID=414 RepID=UPI003CE9D693
MSKPGLPKSQAAKAEDKYRVTNWPDDDRTLVRRGDMTVGFEEDFLRRHWHGKATGNRGKPLKYADTAIQTLLMLKAVFGLPYRATERIGTRRVRPTRRVYCARNADGLWLWYLTRGCLRFCWP